MYQANTIVSAQVEQVAPFGVFLRKGDLKIFVHMSELSWVGPCGPSLHYHVGQVCDVLVSPQLANNGCAHGSFKRAHPEADLSGMVSAGDVLQGSIFALHPTTVTITLGPHLFVDYLLNVKEGIVLRGLEVGDRVALTVARDATEPYILLVPTLSAENVRKKT